VQDNDNSYNNDFILTCRSRSFRFQCDGANSKKSWIEDVRKSISGEHEEDIKESGKSRDALLRGDLTLTEEAPPKRKQPVKEDSESDDEVPGRTQSPPVRSSSHRQKTNNSNPSTSNSPNPGLQKKKEPKAPKPEPESFLLIDIGGTSTTYRNDTVNYNTSNANPFAPKTASPNLGNPNPFAPNTSFTSSGNPFLSNGQTSNPFAPQSGGVSTGQTSNPFSQPGYTSNPFAPQPQQNTLGNTGNPFVANTNTTYNPFQPTPKTEQNYNPFQAY